MKQLPLPFTPALERWPELAPLAILDAALSASESALLAACPDLHHGTSPTSRGTTAQRAGALILQARRLATAIAAYRSAVDRSVRRYEREMRRARL